MNEKRSRRLLRAQAERSALENRRRRELIDKRIMIELMSQHAASAQKMLLALPRSLAAQLGREAAPPAASAS